MFLRRSLASLARVHISYMYMIYFLCRYIWGLAPPPPPYQKAGYATVASFRSPEEWPNEDGRFRPPPPTHYTKSPPLMNTPIYVIFVFISYALKARSKTAETTERQYFYPEHQVDQDHLQLCHHMGNTS